MGTPKAKVGTRSGEGLKVFKTNFCRTWMNSRGFLARLPPENSKWASGL